MPTLVRLIRRPAVVAITGLGTAGLAIVFVLDPFPHTGPGDPHVVALQTAFTAERFASIIAAWQTSVGADAIQNFRLTVVWLDFAFPVFYGLFLASLLAYLWTPADAATRARHVSIAVLIPLVAAALDVIENLLHLVALGGAPPLTVSTRLRWLVGLASTAATAKFLALLGSIILVVVGIVRCRTAEGEHFEP